MRLIAFPAAPAGARLSAGCYAVLSALVAQGGNPCDDCVDQCKHDRTLPPRLRRGFPLERFRGARPRLGTLPARPRRARLGSPPLQPCGCAGVDIIFRE